jgi:sugar phosphate isomerase/epimerase
MSKFVFHLPGGDGQAVMAAVPATPTPLTDAAVLPMTIDGIFVVPATKMRDLERSNAALIKTHAALKQFSAVQSGEFEDCRKDNAELKAELERLRVAVDAMMRKLGYLTHDDRTVSVVVMGEALFIQRQLESERYSARVSYGNELSAIAERHQQRLETERKAHLERLNLTAHK